MSDKQITLDLAVKAMINMEMLYAENQCALQKDHDGITVSHKLEGLDWEKRAQLEGYWRNLGKK